MDSERYLAQRRSSPVLTVVETDQLRLFHRVGLVDLQIMRRERTPPHRAVRLVRVNRCRLLQDVFRGSLDVAAAGHEMTPRSECGVGVRVRGRHIRLPSRARAVRCDVRR